MTVDLYTKGFGGLTFLPSERAERIVVELPGLDAVCWGFSPDLLEAWTGAGMIVLTPQGILDRGRVVRREHPASSLVPGLLSFAGAGPARFECRGNLPKARSTRGAAFGKGQRTNDQ